MTCFLNAIKPQGTETYAVSKMQFVFLGDIEFAVLGGNETLLNARLEINLNQCASNYASHQ